MVSPHHLKESSPFRPPYTLADMPLMKRQPELNEVMKQIEGLFQGMTFPTFQRLISEQQGLIMPSYPNTWEREQKTKPRGERAGKFQLDYQLLERHTEDILTELRAYLEQIVTRFGEILRSAKSISESSLATELNAWSDRVYGIMGQQLKFEAAIALIDLPPLNELEENEKNRRTADMANEISEYFMGQLNIDAAFERGFTGRQVSIQQNLI